MQSADYIALMPSIKSLPEFDASQYLDSDAAVAAYLTDILEANHPALLAAALGDIAGARGMSEIAKTCKRVRADPRSLVQGAAAGCAAALRHHQPGVYGLGVRLVTQAV